MDPGSSSEDDSNLFHNPEVNSSFLSSSDHHLTYNDYPLVILLDMDCFYVQVEHRLKPETKHKPAAVAQYNSNFRGGGLIAVNYEAKAKGVCRRGTRFADEATKICPEIIIFHVNEVRGKADLSKYRQASTEVFNVLVSYNSLIKVERASVDEAYLDITDYVSSITNKLIASLPLMSTLEQIEEAIEKMFPMARELQQSSYVDTNGLHSGSNVPISKFYHVGISTKQFLSSWQVKAVLGNYVMYDIRRDLLMKTKYEASAGLSFSKTVAKLACSLMKPNRQTVIFPSGITWLWQQTPLATVRGYGGQAGERLLEMFPGAKTMADMLELTSTSSDIPDHLKCLLTTGFDGESVKHRVLPRSIAASKLFRGPSVLTNEASVKHWCDSLLLEVIQRCHDEFLVNNRLPGVVSVSSVVSMSSTETPTPRQVSKCSRIKFDRSNHDKTSIAGVLRPAVAPLLDRVISIGSQTTSLRVMSLSVTTSSFVEMTSVQQQPDVRELFDRANRTRTTSSSLNNDESFDVKSCTNKTNEKEEERKLSESVCESFSLSPMRRAAILNTSPQKTSLTPSPKRVADSPVETDQSKRLRLLQDEAHMDETVANTSSKVKDADPVKKLLELLGDIDAVCDGDDVDEKTEPTSSQGALSSTATFEQSSFTLTPASERAVTPYIPNYDQGERCPTVPSRANVSSSSTTVSDMNNDIPTTSERPNRFGSARPTMLYHKIDVAQLDVDMLRGMPLDVQKEYSEQLGLGWFAKTPPPSPSVPITSKSKTSRNSKRQSLRKSAVAGVTAASTSSSSRMNTLTRYFVGKANEHGRHSDDTIEEDNIIELL